jgi:hypothetical protein
MDKGYILTWDSLIALSIILVLLSGFIGLEYFQSARMRQESLKTVSDVSENALDTLSKSGVLDEVGGAWSNGNYSYAGNLSKEYLDQLIPDNMGYQLVFIDSSGQYLVVSRGGGDFQNALDQTRARRSLSGYKEDNPRFGWVSRAWLFKDKSSINRKVYRFDGGSWTEYDSVVISYPEGTPFNDIFYLRIPQDYTADTIEFNVSWSGSVITLTTTSTTTTSSTSTTGTVVTTTIGSTTSTTIADICKDCPPQQSECEVELYPGNGYEHNTPPTSSNFHDITVSPPPGCNMDEVYIEVEPVEGSAYVLYTPAGSDILACPEIGETHIPYNCVRIFFKYEGNIYKSVGCNNIEAAAEGETYIVQVDCYVTEAGHQCNGYNIYTYYEGEGCEIPTTTSSSSTSSSSTSSSSSSSTSSSSTSTSSTSSSSSSSSTSSSSSSSSSTILPSCSDFVTYTQDDDGSLTEVVSDKLRNQDHTTGTNFNACCDDIYQDDMWLGCGGSGACDTDGTLTCPQQYSDPYICLTTGGCPASSNDPKLGYNVSSNDILYFEIEFTWDGFSQVSFTPQASVRLNCPTTIEFRTPQTAYGQLIGSCSIGGASCDGDHQWQDTWQTCTTGPLDVSPYFTGEGDKKMAVLVEIEGCDSFTGLKAIIFDYIAVSCS